MAKVGDSAHTPHGLGTIKEVDTIRGRSEFRVAGKGFDIWVPETKLRVANPWGASYNLDSTIDPGNGTVNDDNSTTLPYDPTPQYSVDLFRKDQTIQPGEHEIDADDRLHSSDSLTGDKAKENRPYPGPSPDLFAKSSAAYYGEFEDTDPERPEQYDDEWSHDLGDKVDRTLHQTAGQHSAPGFKYEDDWLGDTHVSNPPKLHTPNSYSQYLGDVPLRMERQDGPGNPGPNRHGAYRPAGLNSRYAYVQPDTRHDEITAFRNDPDGFIQARNYDFAAAAGDAQELFNKYADYSDLTETDDHMRTAAWSDVRAKAMRLRHEGRVHVKDMSWDRIYATVEGDNGTYDTMIAKSAAMGGQSISNWHCGCEWGRWAFQRRFSYVGRLCSHAYAAYLDMQSQHMKDNPGHFKKKTAGVIEEFKKYLDDNDKSAEYSAIADFAHNDVDALSEDEVQTLYDWVDAHPHMSPERDYDQSDYNNDPEKAYKKADILQQRPDHLVPRLQQVPHEEDSENRHEWTDLTKDERETTGPDDIVHFSAIAAKLHGGRSETFRGHVLDPVTSALHLATPAPRNPDGSPMAPDHNPGNSQGVGPHPIIPMINNGVEGLINTTTPQGGVNQALDAGGAALQHIPQLFSDNPTDRPYTNSRGIRTYPGTGATPPANAAGAPGQVGQPAAQQSPGVTSPQGDAGFDGQRPGAPSAPGAPPAPPPGPAGTPPPAVDMGDYRPPPAVPPSNPIGVGQGLGHGAPGSTSPQGVPPAPGAPAVAPPAGAVTNPGTDTPHPGGSSLNDPNGNHTYQVQKGDTLSDIAQRSGLGGNYQDLAKSNGISNPDLIHPGDTINLPGAKGSNPAAAGMTDDASGKGPGSGFDNTFKQLNQQADSIPGVAQTPPPVPGVPAKGNAASALPTAPKVTDTMSGPAAPAAESLGQGAAAIKPPAPGKPLNTARRRYAETDDVKTRPDTSEAAGMLDRLRELSDKTPSDSFGHMDERNEEVRDLVEKLNDAGVDASQFVASLRYAADTASDDPSDGFGNFRGHSFPNWADEPFQGSGPDPKFHMSDSASYVDEHERPDFQDVDDLDGDIIKFNDSRSKPQQGPGHESAYNPHYALMALHGTDGTIGDMSQMSGVDPGSFTDGESAMGGSEGTMVASRYAYHPEDEGVTPQGMFNPNNPSAEDWNQGSGDEFIDQVGQSAQQMNPLNGIMPGGGEDGAGAEGGMGELAEAAPLIAASRQGSFSLEAFDRGEFSADESVYAGELRRASRVGGGARQQVRVDPGMRGHVQHRQAHNAPSPDSFGFEGVPDASAYADSGNTDIVAAFQRSGAADAVFSTQSGHTDDFASSPMVQGFLRTAGRKYSPEEMRQLEAESHPLGARNLPTEEDLAGTHYLMG